jgi:hypothetical protein
MRVQVSIAAALSAIAALLGGAGCSTRCDLHPCDIRKTSCQRATAAGAACLRGVPPIDVPMKVVSRDDYLAQVRGNSAASDLEQQANGASWITAMGLLGLGDPELSLQQAAVDDASWVGGYYSPAEKAITIIDYGQPLDSMDYVAMLAHEYTHALQDRDLDFATFDRTYIRNTDSALAAGALIEGEATVVGDLSYLSQFGTAEDGDEVTDLLHRWQEDERKSALSSANPALLAPMQFRYAFGAGYAWDLRARAGWSGVTERYQQPPVMTTDILAVADMPAWNGASYGHGQDLGALMVPDLPGFQVVSVDSMGAWLFEVFLDRLGIAGPVSQGLRRWLFGDSLAILRQGSDVVVSWRLRIGSANDVVRYLQSRRFSAWSSGDGDVVVVATNNPTLAPLLAPGALTWKPAPSEMPVASGAMAIARAGCRFIQHDGAAR